MCGEYGWQGEGCGRGGTGSLRVDRGRSGGSIRSGGGRDERG